MRITILLTSYKYYYPLILSKFFNTIRNCIITDFYSGILLAGRHSSNNILTNNIVNNNNYGILLTRSSNNILTNNTANNNNDGIYLSWFSRNNILTNNTANNNSQGIYLHYFSNNNILTNNTANNNSQGIYLWRSSNNILINNTMNNNTFNFNIDGWVISHFYHDIDASNKVNGKPIYYWTYEKNAPNNCRNLEINELSNVGFVALVSCENITIKNINLTNNGYGILLVNTSNSKILNNTVENNIFGIYLYYFSYNNTLTNNIANKNSYGIYLSSSDNNTLTNNIANKNSRGIYLRSFYFDFEPPASSNNILINNTANNNNHSGIYLHSSLNNTLTNNTMNNNTFNFYIYGEEIFHYYQDIDISNKVDGKLIYYWTNEKNAPNNCKNLELNETSNAGFVALVSCENITVKNLNLTNNSHGILLVNTSNSKILNNTANNNWMGIYFRLSNNNTMISNNMCYNLRYDVYNEENVSSTAGNNNTCVTFHNYNDDNSTGCKYACPIDSCNCSTCRECNYKLFHPLCPQVNLTANIIDQLETCIDNPGRFNNKIFDCQGNTIDGNGKGYGIFLDRKINNTIRNCIITDFESGIYLSFSSNNTLINNTANNNIRWGWGIGGRGIYLLQSVNNTITNNTANNNWYGIYLSSSSNNILTNNTANNSRHRHLWRDEGHGIYLLQSVNNTLINNMANNNIFGISLWRSSNNTLIENMANNNTNGLYMDNSVNNSIIQNIFCFNFGFGQKLTYDIHNIIHEVNGTNYGLNNTCDITYNHDDVNTTGCKNRCSYVPFAPFIQEKWEVPDDNKSVDGTQIYIALNDVNVTKCVIVCDRNNVSDIDKVISYVYYPNNALMKYDILENATNNSVCRQRFYDERFCNIYEGNLTLTRFYPTGNYTVIVVVNDSTNLKANMTNKFELIDVCGNDTDQDGIGDACDNCKNVNNSNQSDIDGDRVGDICDNCINISNTNQVDSDNDGMGDACDDDADNDNISNSMDNCWKVYNPNQNDSDNDTVGDACDNCWNVSNFDQADPDNDNLGSACDNCLRHYNPDQKDSDNDGIGDACEDPPRCWSADINGNEENVFFPGQNVYVKGQGLPSNTTVCIYVINPDNNNWINGTRLVNFFQDTSGIENVTTDTYGNLSTTLIWPNIPPWRTLPSVYFDIVIDVNRNGKYDKGIDVVDSLSTGGFSVDPVWASDSVGNVKDTFTVNEIVYVNGSGLPVKNTNITLYIFTNFDNWDDRVGSKFGDWNPITNKTNVLVDAHGDFTKVVAIGNFTNKSYDVIADLNNDGIIQQEEVNGMDGKADTGFNVIIDEKVKCIFDAVEMLEYLSGEKVLVHKIDRYDLNSDKKVDLHDVIALIKKILIE